MRFEIIDNLLSEYNVQPVGEGYLDCIVRKENLMDFVAFLNSNAITVTAVSWWCHCDDKNKIKYGCPHGFGGVKSIFFEGYFSELPFDLRKWDFANNDDAVDYVLNRVKNEDFYSDCLVPGLALQF